MVEAVAITEIPVKEQYDTLVTDVRTYLQNCEIKKAENKNRGIGLPHLLNVEVSEDPETNCIYFQDPRYWNLGLKQKDWKVTLVNWELFNPTAEKKEYFLNESQQQLFLDIFSEKIYLAEQHLNGNTKANITEKFKDMLSELPKIINDKNLIQTETRRDLYDNLNFPK